MEKSYVSLDQKQCPICCKLHEVGILLDGRLRKTMDKATFTGHQYCPECKEKTEEDYIAFVEVSNTENNTKLQNKEAVRTGRICWVKKRVVDHVVNVPITTPMVFCTVGTIEEFEKLQKK